MTEADIEKKFCKKLTKLGWQCIKLGQDGWPDRLALGPGVATFIEFKTPTGKLSNRQVEKRDWLSDNNHFIIIVRSSDEKAVEDFLCLVENYR